MIKVVAWSIGLAVTVVSAVSHADNWDKLGFHGRDDRIYTGDNDWFFGDNKGECGYPPPPAAAVPIIAGLSAGYFYDLFPEVYTDAILCASPPSIQGKPITVDYSANITLNDVHGDDRRDSSMGDWAPGLVKMECGPTEVMTAIAQSVSSLATNLDGARCNPAYTDFTNRILINGATDCAALPFSFTDNRESTSRGDWDYGYVKGECAPGRYIKGVAGGGGPNSFTILCCTPF